MRVSIVHTLKFFSSRFKVYFSRPTFTKLNLGYVRLGYFTLFHFGNKIRGVSVVHTLKFFSSLRFRLGVVGKSDGAIGAVVIL